MSQTKVTYVAQKDVFVADKRGNVKVLKVGTVLNAKEFAALKVTQQAKFQRVETLTVRAQKALERAARIEQREYTPDQFDQIENTEAREDAYRLQAVWEYLAPGVPFSGVKSAEDRHDELHRTNWYVSAQDWSAELPPMVCGRQDRFTQVRKLAEVDVHPNRGGYVYSTVTVKTALAHAKAGRELFTV